MLRTRWGGRDESGASAVEYGLIVVAIAALIVIIVFALGNVVQTMFGNSCQTIKNATQATGSCQTS
jgi:pilus assembly protein Flp/PilA